MSQIDPMRTPTFACLALKTLCGVSRCSVPVLLLAICPAISAKEDVAEGSPEGLYTQGEGKDLSFQELIDQGVIVKGSNDGRPVAGTKINVNNEMIEGNIKGFGGTVWPDSIHTHVKSGIRRKSVGEWSRWYQEDGNTQVFRLFKGEQSVRSLTNMKAGRIEAVKSFDLPDEGGWVEWQATYTIAKPGSGCIFQLFPGSDPDAGKDVLWAVHIDQTPEGDINMLRRRAKGDEERSVPLAKGAIGKNVTVKVRYDGEAYEVSRRIEGQDSDFVFVGKGSYVPAFKRKVIFRWGIYQGSKPGSSIAQDCILFVTGVKLSRSGEDGK